MPLLALPADVLLHILARLPVRAVLAVRCTCRSLAAVSRLRPLWARLLRMHVLAPRLPAPGDDPEAATRRALALRRAWSAPRPVPRATTVLASADPARVIFLQFLPARAHRWLVSVRMTDAPPSFLLQCWDLAATPRCVALLRHADGPYGGVVLNSDPSSTAILAMQSAQTETFSIRFDAEDPECAFETEATIDGIRELHLLSGNTLATRRVDGGGALCLWDLDHLAREQVQLVNPSLVQPDDRVQAIHLAGDYAVVVRVQSLEIYSTTPRPNLVPLPGAPIAYPLAQFRFQWRTDTVVLCAHHAPAPVPPIHLFVRFSSIYPWPVNVLHHYVLPPNPAHRAPTTEYNLPYDPRPSAVHTIGSPVRLFGQSVVALGRYGTALWVDHHTEEWLGPNEHGQRLAGRMITAMPSESGVTAGAEMVFRVCDDDAWTRVAMDEEAGRIALGHVDGAITLLEY